MARRVAARYIAGLILLVGVAAGGPGAAAQPVQAELSVDTTGGFARIVYRFNGDVDANVRMSNGILLLSFKTPAPVTLGNSTPLVAPGSCRLE